MRGCGKLVTIHQSAEVNFDIFRGKSTIATANPSGTLCTAKLAEMKIPSSDPLLPPKETPIPIPSLKELHWTNLHFVLYRVHHHFQMHS